MSLTTCKLHFMKRSDHVVYISKELARFLQLRRTKEMRFQLGKNSVIAAVKTLAKRGKHLYFSTPVYSELRIPHQGSVYVKHDSRNEIRIGPLIGVMTLLSSRSAAKYFLKAGADKSYVFAFSPEDVDWDQETVRGYFLKTGGGWILRTVPLPDVIFNRLFGRSKEDSNFMQQFRERLVKRNIPFFNWSYFNKWEIYDLIHNDPEASKHLPESHINPTPAKMKEMLHKYRFIYLKPSGGYAGKGIFRLTYIPAKGYFARFRRGNRNILLRFSNFSRLMDLLRASKVRLPNYIAQQGIRLIQIDNNPIDFRFHLNKNGSNEWVVAGIGAKRAGKGSVTTHVRTGGQIITSEYALRTVFGSDADHILHNAVQTAIMLAEKIEQNYPHLIGELGFDIGVDQNEQVWLFEANSKPGRTIFKHPELKQSGKTSAANLFKHCLYLSHFTVNDDM